MNPKINRRQGRKPGIAPMQELLILADGRVMTHNLTPAIATVLRELNPDDEPMRQRAGDWEGRSSDEL